MRRLALLAMLVIGAAPGAPIPAHGDDLPIAVRAGYDLFATDPTGTHYGPLYFRGVPGCALVPEATNTDTIVQRVSTATPEQPHTRIVARCLQLQGDHLDLSGALPGGPFRPLPDGRVQVGSVSAGVDQIFVTLQTDRGRHPTDALADAVAPARPSEGNLLFRFAPDGSGGTFDSDLKVYFDVRLGSVDGPIVFTSLDPLAPFFHSWNTPWAREAPVGSGGSADIARTSVSAPVGAASIPILEDQHRVLAPADLVRGVDFLTNGFSPAEDFFPVERRG